MNTVPMPSILSINDNTRDAALAFAKAYAREQVKAYAQSITPASLAADAQRWQQVRAHWKNAKFTFRKDPSNTLKTVTLRIDFDHNTGGHALVIEREFDAVILTAKGAAA